MPAELTYLLDTLQDPDKRSSIIPLVITLFFLLLISLVSLIILISAIRMFGVSLPRFRLPRIVSPWDGFFRWGRRKGDTETSQKILYHDMPVTDNAELERLRKENALLRDENSKLMVRINGLETQVQAHTKENKEAQQVLTQAHYKVRELQKHGAQLESTLEEICREIEGLYSKGSDTKTMETIGHKLEHLLREASLHSAMGNAIHVSDAHQTIEQQAKEIQKLKELLVAVRAQVVELSKEKR